MIRIADPTKLGPAIEELRTLLGVSRRALARAVANTTHRDTDSVNAQIWAWERTGRSPHSGSLTAVLDELGWGLAFVPLDEGAPPAPAVTPQAAENGPGVVPDGTGASDGSTALSGGEWNWTPTADGGSYSGPHGPDICPTMGCQHGEGGEA